MHAHISLHSNTGTTVNERAELLGLYSEQVIVSMLYELDNTLRGGFFDRDCDRVIYHLRDLQRDPLPGGPAL
jgi:hypothetical protein